MKPWKITILSLLYVASALWANGRLASYVLSITHNHAIVLTVILVAYIIEIVLALIWTRRRAVMDYRARMSKDVKWNGPRS